MAALITNFSELSKAKGDKNNHNRNLGNIYSKIGKYN